MNKNVLVLGLCGVALSAIGYGLYKAINKKSEEKVEEVKEDTKEISTEEYVDELFKEEAELEEHEEQEKKSLKDQNAFTDKVSESKEFEALNKMREVAGKEPLDIDNKFKSFLGKDKDSDKSVKESLDSIAEGIKKDPKLKKKILDILSE